MVALREWLDSDVQPMVAMLADPEIARWTRVPTPYGARHATEFIARMRQQRMVGEAIGFAVVDARGSDLLGSIDLRVLSWEHLRGEVGYLVGAHARGRGVAPRAVRLLSSWGFAAVGLRRIGILVDPRNAASQRVAAKAGFTREGVLRSYSTLKDERVDMISYSLLPDDL